VGVHFRIPDDQQVWVGHYGQAHRWLSAAEAVAQFAAASDPLGWEVVIPRRIEANEIHNTRRLRQVVGWRFYPEAKGKPPFFAHANSARAASTVRPNSASDWGLLMTTSVRNSLLFLSRKFHDAIGFMNARRLTACFTIISLSFVLAFPSLSPAQRRAETADDCMNFARAFLRLFYPELSGKNYAITFETASRYDEPVGDAERIFLVDIGDGAKYQVLECCFGSTMGGIVGPQLPGDKDLGPHAPLPAPPPPPKVRSEKPPNIDSRGAVHPNQYLSTVFVFDSQGRLKSFVWKGPASEAGARYALRDRAAFERDLPFNKLERFLGKLKILRKEFSTTTNNRLDKLEDFGICSVFLQTGDIDGKHLEYEAEFESERGELVGLRIVTGNK